MSVRHPVRRAVDDLGPMTEIYNHYVVRTAITFDIDPRDGRGSARLVPGAHHGRRTSPPGGGGRGRIVGYAGTGTFRAKRAYDTTVETTIYVASGCEQRGLGARLYAALFEALVGEPVHRAVAGVTLPNPASLALHARFGFREVGVFRENGRKLDRYWDVMWLERAL